MTVRRILGSAQIAPMPVPADAERHVSVPIRPESPLFHHCRLHSKVGSQPQTVQPASRTGSGQTLFARLSMVRRLTLASTAPYCRVTPGAAASAMISGNAIRWNSRMSCMGLNASSEATFLGPLNPSSKALRI